MNRRRFLGLAAGLAGFAAESKAASLPAGSLRIIDTHIHLFDPTRPQGVPWPPKDDAVLYRPALPERYRRITKGLGIVGAVVVECSPWIEDNQWVLDVAAKDTIIVGMVGNLEPGRPDFGKHLERFHRQPLFRGIRYGNLWGRSLADQLSSPAFISDLRLLADSGLALDTANPDPPLISALVRLTDKVASLRVVVDHLPQLAPDPQAHTRLQADVKELGKRPQVFVKISEVLRRVRGTVAYDLNSYRATLDELCDIFGEDRLIYGSDWPNSDHWGSYPQVLNVVREYFRSKATAAAQKFFWANSVAAYHWIKREPGRPQYRGVGSTG